MTLEASIPLGKVSGRIDHLAFDPVRHRLYVAELGNNSVGIVDLAARRLLRTVDGFAEPQGVGYEPSTDAVYVASGGDGSVRVFSGADFTLRDRIGLERDADNVRIDLAGRRVFVGYGDGAIAVIDAASRKRGADIGLDGHPESFQLSPDGDRIFINVPAAGQVAVVSRKSAKSLASWPTGGLRANYPMAVDSERGRVLVAFRMPATLVAFDSATGEEVGRSGICTDADDVFVDERRSRIYVICGVGAIDVLDARSPTPAWLARLPTSAGSRTGLLIPQLDILVVAIRAAGAQGAALWLYRLDGSRTPPRESQ